MNNLCIISELSNDPDDPQPSTSTSSSSTIPIVTSTPCVSDHFQQPNIQLPRAQRQMTEFIHQSKPISVTKKKQFDEQLTKMIVKK